jgi:hypothetical protein
VWVYDVPEQRLTFLRRRRSRKNAGDYIPLGRSLTFPFLTVDDVAPWLLDDEPDDGAFDRKVRKWVKTVLRPRLRSKGA